ncbi:MAG: hypothetical protein U0441_19815 [Polyangiaceae bacterium]
MNLRSSHCVLPLSLSLLAAALSAVGCTGDGASTLEEEEAQVAEARQAIVTSGLFVVSNNTIFQRGALGFGTGNDWAGVLGNVYGVSAMAVHEGELYVVAGGDLYKNSDLSAGSWVPVGTAQGATAMASFQGALYMTAGTGLYRRGSTAPGSGNDWTYVGEAYGVTSMAAYDGSLYVTSNNALWRRGAIGPETGNDWVYSGDASWVTGMATYNGSLYVASNNALWRRGAIGPGTGNDWSYAGDAYGIVAMAAPAPTAPVMGKARCGDRVRLRSWKGDYLHRPDSAQGVTTWNTGAGNLWTLQCNTNGTVQLRSWKGDYLHRPDSAQGVTTWSNGDWTVEPKADGRFSLKSWKGDYLHRPYGPGGVTTWSAGEWTAEVIAMGTASCGEQVRLRSWKGDYLHRYGEATLTTWTNGDTWATNAGNVWTVECKDNGAVQLRSFKGDYVYRPDTPAGAVMGSPSEWRVEGTGESVSLRSWRGDFLSRPDTIAGVTTSYRGSWVVERLAEQSAPRMRLTNQDVNGDGTRELLLVVESPSGGGFVVTDPFAIAEALKMEGYGLGSDTDFWDALSPVQQSSLLTTVQGVQTWCSSTQTCAAAIPDIGTKIEASKLYASLSNVPADKKRSYEVTAFTGDFDFARTGLNVPVTLFSGSVSSANGTLTVDATYLNTHAAARFGSDGVAFAVLGNAPAFVVLTKGVGDPSGTNGSVSLNLALGKALYGQIKFGQDGQYGFNVPLVVVPVGVSVYLKGSDVEKGWNATSGSIVDAASHVADWNIDWSHDLELTAVDVSQDAAFSVVNASGSASVFARESGRQATVWLGGQASSVGAPLKSAVDVVDLAMRSPQANAASQLGSWGVSAGASVTSVYDSASGWLKGAAGSASGIVDDIEDFFSSWF